MAFSPTAGTQTASAPKPEVGPVAGQAHNGAPVFGQRLCVRTRADRCPGVLRPYPAPDGHLARVRLPGGRLTPHQLRAIARGAQLGSGVIELTSRANLQLRGLSAKDVPSLAALLEAAHLLPSPAHDRVRNIVANPLAGRHPASRLETDPLISALDQALCAQADLASLSGRFLFAVEDGSGVGMRSDADIVLLPHPQEGVTVGVAGHCLVDRAKETPSLAPAEAIDLALGLARSLLTFSPSTGERPWRLWDLGPRLAELVAPFGLRLGKPLPLAPKPVILGPLRQRDGRLALTVKPIGGKLKPAQLEQLTTVCASTLRLSVQRTVTVVDLDPAASAPVVQVLAVSVAEGAGGR